LRQKNITSEIIHGSFLNITELNLLPNNTNVILLSHAAYYTNDVTHLVNTLMSKASDNTLVVFFHQTHMSKISLLREKYKLDTLPTPGEKIKLALEAQEVKITELHYPARIIFPDHINITDILTVDNKINKSFPKEIRNLLEFIIHAPLEYLEDNDRLYEYINYINQNLKLQSNIFYFWDVMQVAIKKDVEYYYDVGKKEIVFAIEKVFESYSSKRAIIDTVSNQPSTLKYANDADNSYIQNDESLEKCNKNELQATINSSNIGSNTITSLITQELNTKGYNSTSQKYIIDALPVYIAPSSESLKQNMLNIDIYYGATFLQIAFFDRNQQVIEALIREGIDVNESLGDNLSPIELATQQCSYENMMLLKNAGANFLTNNKNKMNLIHLASSACINSDIFDLLLDNGLTINEKNRNNVTNLLIAAEYNNIFAILYLLRKGANPNLGTLSGVTPLLKASENGFAEIVSLLIKMEADPNLLREDGVGPLHFACQK
jgi:ankyrin repeat protein